MMVMLELFDDGAADVDGDDLSPWNTNQPNPRLLDTNHAALQKCNSIKLTSIECKMQNLSLLNK